MFVIFLTAIILFSHVLQYDWEFISLVDTQRGGCFSVKSEGECKGKVASHLSYSGCCNGGGKFWGPDCLKCKLIFDCKLFSYNYLMILI